jgi:hypothetical protein
MTLYLQLFPTARDQTHNSEANLKLRCYYITADKSPAGTARSDSFLSRSPHHPAAATPSILHRLRPDCRTRPPFLTTP